MNVLVIVAAYNEEDNIGRCLNSLESQRMSNISFEVVVVDNGSTDSTRSIVERYDVKYISCPLGSIGKVRNEGIKYTDSDVVAFLDADCAVSNDWILNGFSALQNDLKIGGIQGTILSPVNGTVFERLWAPSRCLESSRYVGHVATGSCFFPRKAVVDAGMFDENLKTGEDTDLSRKIKANGYYLMQRDDCSAVHYGFPRALRDFFWRQFYQGKSYSKLNGFLIDTTFFSVVLFGVSLLLSVLLLLFSFWVLGLSFMFISFLVVSAYSLYRCYWVRNDVLFWEAPLAFFVNAIYFLGRFFGFFYSLLSGKSVR